MDNFKKIDVKNSIQRVNNFYDSKVLPFKNQFYDELKRDSLRNKRLFTDPIFPANNSSMFFKSSTPPGIVWKRARDIALENKLIPKLIVNSAQANDLCQGYIGDCWFIAAAAAIAQVDDLFDKILPKDQSFENREYAGIFHFRFWLYGSWYDVVIDDYLPVWKDSGLVFCKNKAEPNEFWPALIEKAYAKVYGSYECLDGGFTVDALVDMSGGIQETYDLKSYQTVQAKGELWEIIVKSRQLKSMTAAYIDADPYVREARLSNGLVMGHAYTVTRIALVEFRGKDVKLIRVRNPWGNEVEWTGPWSDNSREWDYVSDEFKSGMDFKKEKEGEFWMSYDDFLRNFNNIQFCNLTPDAFSEEVKDNKLKQKSLESSTWKMVAFHGEWIDGKSAGGCGQGANQDIPLLKIALFWQNPQFLVTLSNSGINNDKCTIIISLMQKNTREKRMKFNQDSNEEFIQFRIFKIKNIRDVEASKRNSTKLYANQLERVGTSDSYINRREVTKRFLLPVGDYLIIPSCFDFGHECEFLVRVFTEKPIEGNNTIVLTEDKKNLTDEDIYFFKVVNQDEAFSSWVNLLSSGDDGHSSLTENTKPTHVVRPNSSHDRPSSGIGGASAISNLVIKSSFLSNSEPVENEIKDFENQLEVQKVIAKFENKKTVQDACNIM